MKYPDTEEWIRLAKLRLSIPCTKCGGTDWEISSAEEDDIPFGVRRCKKCKTAVNKEDSSCS